MLKRITAIVLCFVLLFCCGCSKEEQPNVEITGTDTKVLPKLENIIELQKSLFVAEIKGVSTVDAVFTKYNVDISKYTRFDVTVTESFDGFTPTGEATVYWLGTDTEFNTRLDVAKNEKYIFDCDMWVYGDEVVYLLSPYTDSYPKVDIADSVTIAISNTEALDVCTLQEYRDEYNKSYQNVCTRIEGFDTLESTAKRFYDIFEVMNEKNSNISFYKNEEMNFAYVPGDEHIQKTAQKTTELFEIAKNIQSKEDIVKLFK